MGGGVWGRYYSRITEGIVYVTIFCSVRVNITVQGLRIVAGIHRHPCVAGQQFELFDSILTWWSRKRHHTPSIIVCAYSM